MAAKVFGDMPPSEPLQVARAARDFIRGLYDTAVVAVGVRAHPDGWVAEVEAVAPFSMHVADTVVFFRVHFDQAGNVLFHYQSPAGRVDRTGDGYWSFDVGNLEAESGTAASEPPASVGVLNAPPGAASKPAPVIKRHAVSRAEQAVMDALGAAGDLDLVGVASVCGMRLRDARAILDRLITLGLVQRERDYYRLHGQTVRARP